MLFWGGTSWGFLEASDMRTRISILIAGLVLASGLAPAPAYHGSKCTLTGLPTVAGPVAQDAVNEGKIDRFKVKVPAGRQGFLHIQPLNGDADVSVCRSGRAHVCESTNTATIGDGCHVTEANDSTGLFTAPVWGWGPPLRPGTYRVDVLHCFSSRAPTGSCDYSPQDDGALDGLGPIQYLIFFVTN